jgi:peptidoglycan/xylan/chitin deacetylase (PgdA/CDA1 family)
MVSFDRLKDGKRYALTFSYDDGCRQDRRLVALFDKYGMKATFNLNSRNMLNPNTQGIRPEEIRPLFIEKGHEVATHSYSHPHLDRMLIKDQYDEIMRDREELEKASGTIVRGHAYPFGTYNNDTFTAMDTASIVYGRTANASNQFTLPNDFKVWVPTTHHNECELPVKRFIYNVEKAPWRAGGVLYIWGHSYEFDNEKAPVQWEKFEEILSELSKRTHDIWCATNIEIYDYVNAQKQIRRSADGKIFHNPTDIDVWVAVDDKPLCIEAGKTVTID